jgi:hypothetical protein
MSISDEREFHMPFPTPKFELNHQHNDAINSTIYAVIYEEETRGEIVGSRLDLTGFDGQRNRNLSMTLKALEWK